MNFEFKSTFINVKRKRSCLSLNRVHCFWLILVFNASTSIAILWLYLTNRFLPAVLGSYPHGNLYILVLKVLIALKIASSVYAVASIAIKELNKKNLLSRVCRFGTACLSPVIPTITSLLTQPFAYLLNSANETSADSAQNVEYNKHSIINKTNY
jgi:hypothetical protein